MQSLVTKKTNCPYCGESIELVLDTSVPHQSYIEDCEVCCRPIIVNVSVDSDSYIDLQVRNENE